MNMKNIVMKEDLTAKIKNRNRHYRVYENYILQSGNGNCISHV